MVGISGKSLCGTLDAALNFQKEVRKNRQSQDPVVGKRIFQYMHIKIMVHGDDFASSGTRSSLKVVREQLAKRFEVKTKVVGR